ncbi:MAG TPA: serine/threonine-protein kinase, partial [Vicinamibacterales bacterium]|nr:serine/threonine-protein kinase [Vicinamibacterales bacterium]
MTLGPGTPLGTYDVTALLGTGGMGEVYRARDTRLNRDVAIKVLPDIFAGGSKEDRLARFEREAQTLASLNHPNIAHIYGIVDLPDGGRGLVMEYVAGENLAARLTRGALPIDEAMQIARQIADALEAAHEHGIIHRDLKPANVMVNAEGVVKVLDFGLAKAADPSGISAVGVAESPTFTAHMTQFGMIIGTAAYMSPEQARGKTVDRRADIWAFGVVLYEMITGRRA